MKQYKLKKLTKTELKNISGGYVRYVNRKWHVFDNNTEYDIISYHDFYSATLADKDLHNLEFKDRMAANIYAVNGYYGRTFWNAGYNWINKHVKIVR